MLIIYGCIVVFSCSPASAVNKNAIYVVNLPFISGFQDVFHYVELFEL